MEALAPTAQRILAAAQRLLAERRVRGAQALGHRPRGRRVQGQHRLPLRQQGRARHGAGRLARPRLQPRPHRGDGRPAGGGGARARAHRRRDAHRRGRRELPVVLRRAAARAARPGPARAGRGALRRLPRDRAALPGRGRPGRAGGAAAVRHAHDRHRRRPRDPARARPGRRRRARRHRALGAAGAAVPHRGPRALDRGRRVPTACAARRPSGILGRMDAAIIWDEAYAEHDTGAHPEGADRIDGRGRAPRAHRPLAAPRPSSRPGAGDRGRRPPRAHARRTSRWSSARRRAGGTWLDPDTHVSPRSYEIALLSAGGALLATELWDERPRAVRAHPPARPPRHARPGHGLLPVQQHRHRRRAAPRGRATSASPSSTGTCTTATAPRRRSTPSRGCSSARRTSGRTTPAAASSPSAARARARASPSTSRCRPAPTTATTRSVFDVVFDPDRAAVRAAGDPRLGRSGHPPRRPARATCAWTRPASRRWRCAACGSRRSSASGRLAFVLEGGYDRGATARAGGGRAAQRCRRDGAGRPRRGGTERAAAAIARAREVQSAYWDL